MIDKDQDPNLQSPQDANTTKHINFMEIEENGGARTGGDQGDDKGDDNPTKKAWEELRNDNKNEQSSKD